MSAHEELEKRLDKLVRTVNEMSWKLAALEVKVYMSRLGPVSPLPTEEYIEALNKLFDRMNFREVEEARKKEKNDSK